MMYDRKRMYYVAEMNWTKPTNEQVNEYANP